MTQVPARSGPQCGQDLSAQQLHRGEPAVEVHAQVEHQVLHPDVSEAVNLLDHLVGGAGDERALDVLGGGEAARRGLGPPLAPLVGPRQQAVQVHPGHC